MALEKIRLGTNEDGTPHFLYRGDHVVITGSASGVVSLPDGSEVDVTDAAVEADSPEHAQAIADAIAASVAPVEEPAPSSKKKG
jgi:hypothetical protein